MSGQSTTAPIIFYQPTWANAEVIYTQDLKIAWSDIDEDANSIN